MTLLTNMNTKVNHNDQHQTDIKIGVYICHCGHNIASVVDVEKVRDFASGLPGVMLARTNMFCCAEPGQNEIQEDIKSEGINRVLIAACSPRLHEPTFRHALTAAGLNPYLLEIANIREHCSWVHATKVLEATEKACDLVAMGVAKLHFLKPLKDRRVPVTQKALVIGGGAAGIRASLELANMGHPVTLIEKRATLGGKATELWRNFDDGQPLSCLINPLITATCLNNNIEVITDSQVIELSGFVGNFEVQIDHKGEIILKNSGCIIVATGYSFFDPRMNPRYGYANLSGVVTTPELEQMLRAATKNKSIYRPQDKQKVHQVAFIQCVGSREAGEDGNHYCSRVCCLVTIKQATILAREFGCNVLVFHKDIRVLQKWHEQMYRKAREAGVIFLRASIDDILPNEHGDLTITATSEIQSEKVKTAVDLIVLSVGMVPGEDTLKLKETLKIPLSDDGFFLESHPKLHPLETSMDGIFLAGACQGPKDFRESLVTGSGAAAKSRCILSKKELLLDGMIAEIDPELCIGCRRCVKECPYGAIETFKIEGEKKEKARVVSAACKGCGVCAGACPTGAADTLGFTEDAINAQIEEALKNKPEEKILAFCCNWCSYAGADFAGVSRLEYPPTLRIIRVMCSGRVNERFILHAFELGAGRVLVSGCHPPGDCHYISGNLRFQARFPKIQKKLAKKGFNPNYFHLAWISATEGPQFQKLIREINEDLQRDLKRKG